MPKIATAKHVAWVTISTDQYAMYCWVYSTLVHGELVSYIAGCCSFINIAASCMNMADMAFIFYAEAVECMDSTSCMACLSV